MTIRSGLEPLASARNSVAFLGERIFLGIADLNAPRIRRNERGPMGTRFNEFLRFTCVQLLRPLTASPRERF